MHSVLNKYCPEGLHFTLEAMIARTQLVVLDYNCGSNNTHKPLQKMGEHRFKEKIFQSDATLGCEKQKIKNI